MPMFFICSGLCYSNPKTLRENARKILTPYYIGGYWLLYRNVSARGQRWNTYHTDCTAAVSSLNRDKYVELFIVVLGGILCLQMCI